MDDVFDFRHSCVVVKGDRSGFAVGRGLYGVRYFLCCRWPLFPIFLDANAGDIVDAPLIERVWGCEELRIRIMQAYQRFDCIGDVDNVECGLRADVWFVGIAAQAPISSGSSML